MPLNVREISTIEFGHCALLEYDDIEMYVTLDYGPRIVSFRKHGMPNLLYNQADPELERNHGHKMRITLAKSTNGIYCDNSPVRYSPLADGVSFVQTLSEPVHLEIRMDIVFDTDIGSFMVVHSVMNQSMEEQKLSIYTETPFNNDGFVFIPQSNIRETDRPSRILSIWENCRWNDKRLFIGNQYVTVHNIRPERERAGEFQLIGGDIIEPRLKIGINNTAGFCGYIEGKHALIKRYVHSRNALYPFSGCSAFATANDGYISIQNTSPFYIIGPGETARYIESWIFAKVHGNIHSKNEDEIDEFINSV